VIGVGLLLLNAWEWVFGAFFPTRAGTLGHDWAHKLPLLLDGASWFLRNGWTSVPWFTPSFCGGIPLFPHPTSFYVSLPQLLSFFTDPLHAAHYAVLAFAGLGLVGATLLLRRSYGVGPWPALLGGGVFLWNGFYAHRMLIGHLEFHGFMLTPWIATWLLGRAGPAPRRRVAAELLGAGAALAYLFLSGAVLLLFPLGLALLALWLLAGAAVPGFRMRVFPARLAGAGALALALCAGKLVGSLALLSQLPRDFYPLPSIDGFGHALWLVGVALVRGGAAIDPTRVRGAAFPLQRHELEYGVTALPFLWLAAWALRSTWGPRRPGTPRARACAAGLALLLLVPVAVNVTAVSALLERAPLLRSLGSLLRWLAMYVPLLAVGAGLAAERAVPRGRVQTGLVLGSLALVVALNAAADRSYYQAQPYPPEPVVAASQLARARGAPTPIIGVEATIVDGEIQLSNNRNDVLVRGMSQLACYEPLFGYRLERFPRKDLHPGPVLEAHDGHLNLKNPACYVYPDENGCEPGDHFRADQLEAARRFTHFEPFPWKRPFSQRIADALSQVALAAALAGALVLGLAALREHVSRRRRG
jgi:hypothetical protein